MINVFYAMLNPRNIFGMVGRCGGGYNTVWEDWSAAGRVAREHITKEYEEGLNHICGHYEKLEQSILKEGFRNPLIITCGHPIKRTMAHLPPELRKVPPNELFLLEGVTGGSRLWVAQKLGIPVPCIVNDTTGKFKQGTRILSASQAKRYFRDVPKTLTLSLSRGISESYENNKSGYHLGNEWSEDKLIRQRAPLWVSTMNKYGYYVDRLQPHVVQMLAEEGVIQPDNLKKKFSSTR